MARDSIVCLASNPIVRGTGFRIFFFVTAVIYYIFHSNTGNKPKWGMRNGGWRGKEGRFRVVRYRI